MCKQGGATKGLETSTIQRSRQLMMRSVLIHIIYVTLHHEMSRNVPDGHFHIFIFSESKFCAFYNGENHVQIRGLVAKLHVF